MLAFCQNSKRFHIIHKLECHCHIIRFFVVGSAVHLILQYRHGEEIKKVNVNGIGATGYPAAGYETRRAERNVTGGKFSEQAAQATATLHGAEEGSGDIAISSWADVV